MIMNPDYLIQEIIYENIIRIPILLLLNTGRLIIHENICINPALLLLNIGRPTKHENIIINPAFVVIKYRETQHT